jgi:hypothetical protein
MHKGLFAAVIFAMVFASPVHAEGSGGALLEICTSTDATSTAACRTYIHGVAETLHIWLDVDPETVRAYSSERVRGPAERCSRALSQKKAKYRRVVRRDGYGSRLGRGVAMWWPAPKMKV